MTMRDSYNLCVRFKEDTSHTHSFDPVHIEEYGI